MFTMLNSMRELEFLTKESIRKERKFMGVVIDMGEEFPKNELIINVRANFRVKLDYYKKTYDENLKHKYASKIRIIAYIDGNNLEDFEFPYSRWI